MITLDDYLYSGNTVLKILHQYSNDLRNGAKETRNSKYPILAFTFKGRIKSLIRAEEKFNGYILEYIYGYYKKKEVPDRSRNQEQAELSRLDCLPHCDFDAGLPH